MASESRQYLPRRCHWLWWPHKLSTPTLHRKNALNNPTALELISQVSELRDAICISGSTMTCARCGDRSATGVLGGGYQIRNSRSLLALAACFSGKGHGLENGMPDVRLDYQSCSGLTEKCDNCAPRGERRSR